MAQNEWNRAEHTETLFAIKGEDGWSYSGNVSDLMEYVFSKAWTERMGDEHYSYFWEDVIGDMDSREGKTVEIVVDMVYDFGTGEEQDVRDYMTKYKKEGPRFLVMPRSEEVTMACAWLRSYEIKDITLPIMDLVDTLDGV